MKQPAISECVSVVQAPDVVFVEMDGEIMMMRIENGMYYGLDNVGSRIWQLLAEPKKVSYLLDCLSEEFEVERPKCTLDTLDLLNQLYTEGLINIG